jgi:hypothetical protein
LLVAPPRLARRAEPVEEELMKDHRVHRDELLALEPVDDKSRSAREIELGELLLDEVEALHRAAIVVLVVADDRPLGHALDSRRIAAERLRAVGHL